jgi:general secretion pathway protein D
MNSKSRSLLALLIVTCLLAVPVGAFGKKGKDHYDRGMKAEQNQQWEQAAQEFTLALAADPSNVDYRLHYQRAIFNASQMFMQKGRSLAEQRDYVGAYNAFRQALGYDPVNQLAVSEMERMLRLQEVKEGRSPAAAAGGGAEDNGTGGTPAGPSTARPQEVLPVGKPEVNRTIAYSGDLKGFIRQYGQDLNLNVIFDRQSFATPRTIDVNLQGVTTAKALDYVFLQEGLFFQKLDRRTILVADQARRPQYQQLVVRTFYVSNADPDKIKALIGQVLPASVGRPQSIVVSDKDTNSLTVRDTAENVQLIGELIRSIDKDRAEVVMDVNIYEVSRTNLLQLGNQLGSGTFNLGGSPGLSVLTSNAVTTAAQTGVNVGSILAGVPTAAAAALVIPPSVLTAFQSKNNARLLASTQIHAFNNEESTARIGQRVPVQTASVYGYGASTPNTGGTAPGVNPGVFGSNGYPVINYEPTGLTLSFTPIVFPNLDVQVKMKINSKDVAGASTLTPTFTEREITGTARVQNNRTMMLASVTQDVQSSGRQGLPILGGLPVLGRFFTSPTRDNRQVDIVISVTPRVLRAPAVTPRDEKMRESGTLQSPTTGSIAVLMEDIQREEQIAEARRIPKEVNVQLPDAPVTYEPAPNAVAANQSNANVSTTESAAQVTAAAPNKVVAPPENQNAVLTASTKPTAETNKVTATNSAVPQPKETAATQVQQPGPKSMDVATAIKSVVSQGTDVTGTSASAKSDVVVAPAVEQLAPKSEKTDGSAKASESAAGVIELSLSPEKSELQLGEKRQIAVHLNSAAPLGLAVIALRFDPQVVKVKSVSAGSIFANVKTAPTLTQSIDEHGILLVSLTPADGSIVNGEGSLLNIDVEASGVGNSELAFDLANVHVVAKDGRPTALQIEQGILTVKPGEGSTDKPPAPKPIPEETSKAAPTVNAEKEAAAVVNALSANGELGAVVAMGAKVAASVKTQAAASKPKTYLVQKRDNLWRIATEHGVTVAALRQANPRLRGEVLSVGSELVIP